MATVGVKGLNIATTEHSCVSFCGATVVVNNTVLTGTMKMLFCTKSKRNASSERLTSRSDEVDKDDNGI